MNIYNMEYYYTIALVLLSPCEVSLWHHSRQEGKQYIVYLEREVYYTYNNVLVQEHVHCSQFKRTMLMGKLRLTQELSFV